MLPGSARFQGPLDARAALAATASLALGLATIIGAWGFQLIGGYQPCPLCLEQRIPYYVGLPLLALGLLSLHQGWPAVVTRTAFAVAALMFVYGTSLGIQQAGAEWGFWDGPRDCATGAGAAPASVDTLLKALETARVVSCTDVQWSLLGLSFAGWNAVISATLVAMIGWAALSEARAAAR